MATWQFWRREQQPETVKAAKATVPEMIILGTKSGKAVYQEWGAKKAIQEGLKASAVFYACVNLRAQAMAQVPWKVYSVDRDGVRTELPDHPLNVLLKRPHPSFSWSELMQLCSMHIDLAGNFYLKEIRAGSAGKPLELAPLIPYAVSIYPDPYHIVRSYEYAPPGSGQRIQIPATDMIQIKTINPDNFLFGLPTIQAAAKSVDIDRDAGDWQKLSFQNRGVSDVAIVLDENTTQDQYEALKAHYREDNAGPTNARKPFFTTKDVKTLNSNAVEMDYINSRQAIWQEIASAMGVPLPMIGVLTDATLANIQTSRRIFWLDTMLPLLRMVESQLNQQLASEYGDNIVLGYDTSGVEALREDFGAKLAQAQQLFAMGVDLQRIDQMLELGIPDVEQLEGSDIGYIPAGIIPTGADLGMPTGDGSPEDNARDAQLAFGQGTKQPVPTPEDDA